jgi:pentatricopeptide repeat protein
MIENSFKPDVFTCNTLEKALKLFTWISKAKATDAVTYNTLISSLCKEGRFGDAFELVTDLEERKLGPE